MPGLQRKNRNEIEVSNWSYQSIERLFQYPLYFPKNEKDLNEIDMITVNAFEHTADIIEIKRNQEHIDWVLFKVKGDFLSNSRELKGYNCYLQRTLVARYVIAILLFVF